VCAFVRVCRVSDESERRAYLLISLELRTYVLRVHTCYRLSFPTDHPVKSQKRMKLTGFEPMTVGYFRRSGIRYSTN
jgi:hypothetical protein